MRKSFFILASIILLLTGCSGGPSDSQISDALESSIKEELNASFKAAQSFGGKGAAKMMRAMMGGVDPESLSISGLKSEDMKETDKGDYITKISYDVEMGDKKERGNARVTLTEVDGNWKIIGIEKL